MMCVGAVYECARNHLQIGAVHSHVGCRAIVLAVAVVAIAAVAVVVSHFRFRFAFGAFSARNYCDRHSVHMLHKST